MTRKTLRMILVAIVAVFALSSFAEAAGAKRPPVRHRAKHSTRVSSGQRVQIPAVKKTIVIRKRRAAAPPVAKRKTGAAKRHVVVRTKRKPTTKPR